MRLADMESTEVDMHIVNIAAETRDWRLARKLNRNERAAFINLLTGQLTDREIGALLGITHACVFKIRTKVAPA